MPCARLHPGLPQLLSNLGRQAEPGRKEGILREGEGNRRMWPRPRSQLGSARICSAEAQATADFQLDPSSKSF